MSDTSSPEAAVRAYLTYLEDPSKLVDHAAIGKLQKGVDAAKDPIEKLKAIAALDKASATDGDSYKIGFILNAKQWATDNGVPNNAFAQLGVGDDVLRAAGLSAKPAKAGSAAAKRGSDKPRSKSVSSEQIRTHIVGIKGEFTLADIIGTVGGSHMTVRKVVDELLKSKTITLLGRDPKWSSRGRAPFVYKVA